MGDTRVGAPVKRNIMHAPARRNIWALVRPYTRPQQLFLFRQLYPRRAAVSPSVPSSPPSLRLPLSPDAAPGSFRPP